MAKSIVTGELALSKILSGVNLIADAVKATLGPDGKNCVYERLGTNLSVSTRDGVTVAEQIESDDPHVNMGVNMVKGVAREAVDQSGDGTTTATLLAQALFSEGVKAITVGSNPVSIKRGIEHATNEVLTRLKSMAKPVSGDAVRQVATISANNDAFLGGLIADAMKASGEDGVVTVEVSRSPDSSLEIVDGLQLGTGWLSPAFVNQPERNEAVLDDVYILLHEVKLAHITPMLPLIQKITQEGKSLLVIAEDVTDEALAVLAVNTGNKVLRSAAIRTPGSPEHLHDVAALTKGRVLTELLGVKLKDVDETFFGHAKRVIVGPQTTTIIGDGGENVGLAKKLAELRSQVATTEDETGKQRVQVRLARLSGGIAIIKVGGSTELEMLERKDRLEDAMHATRGAIKEGVLPGGGVALARAGAALAQRYDEYQTGTEIVRKACFAPIRTLAENAGEPGELILRKVLESENGNYGWNARTNQFGDLVEMGVLDPLRVVRVALEAGASVSALMLITATLVANERVK